VTEFSPLKGRCREAAKGYYSVLEFPFQALKILSFLQKKSFYKTLIQKIFFKFDLLHLKMLVNSWFLC